MISHARILGLGPRFLTCSFFPDFAGRTGSFFCPRFRVKPFKWIIGSLDHWIIQGVPKIMDRFTIKNSCFTIKYVLILPKMRVVLNTGDPRGGATQRYHPSD